MKKIILIAAAALAIMTLITWGLWKLSEEPSLNSQTFTTSIADWKRGNPDASVELLEYSDFQCPACASYYPILKELEKNYRDRVSFVYRHFPLTRLHPNAEAASKAAEAAGQQNKFWEMHDLLFEKQRDWSNESNPTEKFNSYARELGLDMNKFETDRLSDLINSKVKFDTQEGNKINVTGTPTFYLNDEKIANPSSYEDFKKLIDAKLAE